MSDRIDVPGTGTAQVRPDRLVARARDGGDPPAGVRRAGGGGSGLAGHGRAGSATAEVADARWQTEHVG